MDSNVEAQRNTNASAGALFAAGLLVYPDDAQYMTGSVHLDLSRDRAGTDQEASGYGRCFERIERRGEAPQHRPCARPASGNCALQCHLGWRWVENIS